jgi:hypothetical protein
MNDDSRSEKIDELEKIFEKDLMEQYGPLLTGDDLRRALGYISKDAFRQSMVRNTVPVKLFSLEHKKGKYAFTKDVAYYLASVRVERQAGKQPGGDIDN